MRLPVLVIAFLIAAMQVASADDRAVDYGRDIKPVLKSRCTSCHGSLKQESGLRLDAGVLILKGGDGGPVVKAGDVTASRLLAKITSEDASERMPPEGDPLSAGQIEAFRRWIAAGAGFPEDEQPESDPREHWSFRPIVRPRLPDLRTTHQEGNPVDVFIQADWLDENLTPAPPAVRHILLRRVYLDLIGLPPTREELQAFLADKSPDAYERVVDRLLNRPEYGERWGRHWMDVWRYSDWYGRRRVPDALNSYGQIWRWRDWIVRSLNEDKGYDRMVLEMLAADELAPLDDDNLVATGFIVRNYYRWNYNTWMKDLVEHTGKAFLGITLNCCHCHDHKYDPFTNEEYFAFRAIFEPIDIRQDRVPGEPDPGPYPVYKLGRSLKPLQTGMVRIHDSKLDAKTFMYLKGESRDIIPDRPPVPPATPSFLGGGHLEVKPIDLPPEAWYPGLKDFVRGEEIEKVSSAVASARKALDALKNEAAAEDAPASDSVTLARQAAERRVTAAEAALAAVRARILADQIRYQGADGDADVAAKAASRAERQATLENARLELAQAEHALSVARAEMPVDDKAKQAVAAAEKKVSTEQGELKKAEETLATESTTYTAFSPQYPKQTSGRRLALAKWIVSETNPLTARVAVNHIWSRHFGRPFVESTDNLGRNGSAPTHPELLDWLAVELMENGWRMKHLHRVIVTSQVYRLSSNPGDCDPRNRALDPDNRFLWRFNSRRVEAEVIRDSLLYSAGTLDPVFGGKEIVDSLGLTLPRRSLYFETHGEGQMPWLQLFDAPSPIDCYRRTTSVRPQQALAVSNSELALNQARMLARDLHQQFPDVTDHSTFVAAAFERVLSRAAGSEELALSREFLLQQTKLFQDADLTKQVKETVPPSTDPVLRARENLVHALFSHSDFVTVR